MLRLGEVAELLGISRTKVYELVASGQIPSLHVGRLRRVPLVALRDWIDEQTERATPAYARHLLGCNRPQELIRRAPRRHRACGDPPAGGRRSRRERHKRRPKPGHSSDPGCHTQCRRASTRLGWPTSTRIRRRSRSSARRSSGTTRQRAPDRRRTNQAAGLVHKTSVSWS